MAGVHTRRQVGSPRCLWRPAGTSNRVLEGICYSSSWSLLYFPLSLIHKNYSHPPGATTAHHSCCTHPAADIPETGGRSRQMLSCQRHLNPCVHKYMCVSKKVMQIRIRPLQVPGLHHPEISLWCSRTIPGSLPNIFRYQHCHFVELPCRKPSSDSRQCIWAPSGFKISSIPVPFPCISF